MKKYIDKLEQYLNKVIQPTNILGESMQYSLLAKSKRIRARLLLHFFYSCSSELVELDIDPILPYAAAIEAVHTYSLIHDDLPCMDNDDMRRGKASNHKVYGEDIALLTGDALLNLAYELMLDPVNLQNVGLAQGIAAAKVLADAAGSKGMILGQILDLDTNSPRNVKYLENMYLKKTGALISAACLMGAKLANSSKQYEQVAIDYGNKIGLAFQIIDDILDVNSDEKILGKPIKSDIINNKITYVDVLDINKSKSRVKQLTEDAVNLIKDTFGGRADFLCDLTIKLAQRNS